MDGFDDDRWSSPHLEQCARQPRSFMGSAPLGGSPDVAVVQHQHRRVAALRRNPPRHGSRRPAPRLGVRRRRGDQYQGVAAADRTRRRRTDPAGRPRRRRGQASAPVPADRRGSASGRHRKVGRHGGQRGPDPVDLSYRQRRHGNRVRDRRVPPPGRRRRETHRSGGSRRSVDRVRR